MDGHPLRLPGETEAGLQASSSPLARPVVSHWSAAVCLAAGEGRRLQPLTHATPKVLLTPAGRPLLDLALDALHGARVPVVHVNAFAHAGQVQAHLRDRAGCVVRREAHMLGTGGAVAACRDEGRLDGAELIFVTCADIVTSAADLRRLAQGVRGPDDVVMGLVAAREEPRRFFLDAHSVVKEHLGGPWQSAGLYALGARALGELRRGHGDLVSALLAPRWESGRLRGAVLVDPWDDAGTRSRFLALSKRLLAELSPSAIVVDDAANVASSARLHAPVFIGRGAQVAQGAVLEGSVVHAAARVGRGAHVTASVVGPGGLIADGARCHRQLVG